MQLVDIWIAIRYLAIALLGIEGLQVTHIYKGISELQLLVKLLGQAMNLRSGHMTLDHNKGKKDVNKQLHRFQSF